VRRLKILHNGQTKRYSKFFKFLGPGLITGAADDDPSGIATYSQAGASYGFGQLWSIALCLPLMIAVQETCARIGSVTGKGLVKVTSEIYSKKILYAVVSLVVIANVINIGADIAAVGAALNLLIPLSVFTLSSIFTLVVLLLEIVVGYHAYAKFLKFLALSLLAYVATAFIVGPDWGEVFRSLVIPKITWEANYWYVLVALLGTTISPYMFFWQATEEVEEQKYAIKAGIPKRSLKVIRRDNTLGMTISQIGSLFMIITTAVVLHSNGVKEIGTAADAAKALEPLVSGFPDAGLYAKILFTLGIIGMGLLGIPVLAGSVSYAISDTRNWPQGLDFKFAQAKQFYVVIILATGAGWIMNAIGIDPMKALVFAAVINGLVSIPLIFLISRISKNSEVMGIHTGGPLSRTMLMLTFFVTLAAGLILGISLLRG
jgi:NRAMP (natural resistance-associated macrophage protein)-like metal ion transporter